MSGGRRAMVDPSLGGRARRLRADLDANRSFAAAGDSLARGAALTAAHEVLALAVVQLRSAADRRLRRSVLDAAVAVLADAGFAHLKILVAAALIYDDPHAMWVIGPEGLQ